VAVVDHGGLRVAFPLSVHDVLVLVGAGEQSEADAEIDLAVVLDLSVEVLENLPFLPTSDDDHLVRDIFALRSPDEAGFLGCAGSEVAVATVRTDAWRHDIALIIIGLTHGCNSAN
jgi:hypothetical protein